MKLRTKIIAGIAALAFLTFAAGSLQAQQVTNLLAITATIQEQGGTNNNGTVTTVAAPTKLALNTKQILVFMARDEYAAGRYAFTNFPAGAKLAAIVSETSYICQVLDKNNNLIVDVSNILRIPINGIVEVHSGKTENSTGWGDPTVTKLQVPTIDYDDSGIIGGVRFQCNMTGLMKSTVTYAISSSTKTLGVTTSAKIAAFAGTGSYEGTHFVITGSLSAAGKGTFK